MSLLVQAYLLEKYGPRLTMEQLAQVMGISYGTLRNKVASDTFAVHTYLDEGRRWADVRDVAAHLDRVRGLTQGADSYTA